MATFDADLDKVLENIAATVEELDAISSANLDLESQAPKAVRDRHTENVLRAAAVS
ncbi:hypothetical protein [Mycolicibacterium gadium]|uniref:Uncharacterized protein n=1 Tax=Mycolicibacterium gadium TaxID=1794 RepID=A0A7I7WUY5_MYCGU|nr:hypothetical protein [Mycolicibacterium gadium]BBZ20872.1 hypothetical protein MGAD_52070 [Mycolicibacterium gadium]